MSNILSDIIGGFTTTGLALIAAYFTLIGHSQELNVRMTEIGIGTLRAPPTEDISAIRSWAINVTEKKSKFPFTEQQCAILLKKELEHLNIALRKARRKVLFCPEERFKDCIKPQGT